MRFATQNDVKKQDHSGRQSKFYLFQIQQRKDNQETQVLTDFYYNSHNNRVEDIIRIKEDQKEEKEGIDIMIEKAL